MTQKKQKNYPAPIVEVFCARIEKGFAGSNTPDDQNQSRIFETVGEGEDISGKTWS